MDQEYNQVGVANINGVLFWLTITMIINPYNNALAVRNTVSLYPGFSITVRHE